MPTRLDRLAAAAYPGQDIRAAVFARHERLGARVAFVLMLVGVPIAFELLGWSEWLGAMTGGAAGAASYSLMCRSYVLVVSGHQVRIHRPPRVRLRRVPLGPFDRVIDTDSLRAGRKGPFNDTWWVDDIKMHVEKDLSWHVTDLLERRAYPRPGATRRVA